MDAHTDRQLTLSSLQTKSDTNVNRVDPGKMACYVLSHQDLQSLPICIIACVEVLQPSKHSGVMLSAVSLPNHTFTEQA